VSRIDIAQTSVLAVVTEFLKTPLLALELCERCWTRPTRIFYCICDNCTCNVVLVQHKSGCFPDICFMISQFTRHAVCSGQLFFCFLQWNISTHSTAYGDRLLLTTQFVSCIGVVKLPVMDCVRF